MTRQLVVAARTALVVSVLSVFVIAAACGGDDDSGASASSGASDPAAKGAVDASGKITLIAQDSGGKGNRFVPNEFTATAGQMITLTLDNKGTVLHNFQVKEAKTADGKAIETPLIPAGQSASVQYSLGAGTYEFWCTVHPADMKGSMTVQ